VVDLQYLQSTLEQSLQSLNVVAEKPLELVLFNYAIDHLLAIWRVLRQQGGNALLVGVGGSGKQSLTRLAATFGEYNIIQIEISKTYDQNQWKEDVKHINMFSSRAYSIWQEASNNQPSS
jgi:dynein heavy chain